MIEIKFAENLRLLRLGQGLSQDKLANALGVDQRTVSAWENGICEPSFSMLAKICDYFGENPDDILT